MGAGRRFRRALSLGSAALALASGLALAASTGAGAITPPASPVWLQATSISMPTGALSTAPAQLLGVYCLHDGSFCLAAGSFQKSTTNGDLPMVVSEAGGTWGKAKQLTLPTGAATKARSDASDVWCASSTSCVAVGYYRYSANSGKYNKPFIATMGTGGWNKATGIPLPKNSTTPTNAKLLRISCSSHGNCGAVGTYRDKDGDIEIGGYIQESGKWITSHWIVVPSDAPKAGKTITPYGISCPATGDCVGVGKYNNTAGVVRPFIFTSTNGTWNPGFSINLPANAKSKAGDLHAVSCPDVNDCVAVGNYVNNSGQKAVFAVTETGGTWNKNAQEITIKPSDGATPPAPQLNGLSCVDTATCDAVGSYANNGSPSLVSLLSVAYSTSTWQTAAGVPAPGNSNTTSAAFTQFKDVSCWAQWGCAGVGNYINAGGTRRALVALGNNGAG
ncbi:MAG: hypothetical protein ACM32E_14810 [Gemmatimonadota bacterium]